jgi:hypothetical protein
MTNKTLISPASEKGRFDGIVDEDNYLRQSLLYKQILPRPVRRSFSEGGTPSQLKKPQNPCNPPLINDLQLRKITYEIINLFLQNEPNFRKSQVNVTVFNTRNYEQMDTWSIRKNEPKTNPNEPKTNPILADKTPIRTQFKPNFSRQSRIKANFRGKKYSYERNFLFDIYT